MPIRVGLALNISDAEKAFAHLLAGVADARPVFRRIDADVTGLLREQFSTRGARLGTPWAPLRPLTIQLRILRRMTSRRARKAAFSAAGRDTPLRDSGGMFSAFTKPGAPSSIRTITPTEYERGANYTVDGVPVAYLHHTGWTSTSIFGRRRKADVHVAPRPVVPNVMPAPVIRTWEGYLSSYLEGSFSIAPPRAA